MAPTRRTLAIAAKAHARLHTRYWRLVERRKATHVAATAVAELAGPTADCFIRLTPDNDPWAGWEGPDRSGQLERPRRAARKADG